METETPHGAGSMDRVGSTADTSAEEGTAAGPGAARVPPGAPSVEQHALPAGDLDRFLQRQMAGGTLPDIDLSAQLREILEKARELVPSESGSILLDDPLGKTEDRARNDLFFVAAFGTAGSTLPGQRVAAGAGIVGKVYRTGEPHLSADVLADATFSPEVDRKTGHVTHSVVAVPITIGATVCGVIELINRAAGRVFTARDLVLLEHFARYTSLTLQNALDAKRLSELAKRDDLSGLFNDRWLHVRLVQMITEADATGEPCALLFFDLDGFKSVNDTHGHLVGSQVLREIGYLLRRVVETPLAVLSRYGGDEFVIGLPATALPAATMVGEQVREAIATTAFLDRAHGESLPALNLRGVVTASVGVAAYLPGRSSAPPHEKESDLLRRADAAMYAAKARGKDCVVTSEE